MCETPRVFDIEKRPDFVKVTLGTDQFGEMSSLFQELSTINDLDEVGIRRHELSAFLKKVVAQPSNIKEFSNLLESKSVWLGLPIVLDQEIIGFLNKIPSNRPITMVADYRK